MVLADACCPHIMPSKKVAVRHTVETHDTAPVYVELLPSWVRNPKHIAPDPSWPRSYPWVAKGPHEHELVDHLRTDLVPRMLARNISEHRRNDSLWHRN